MDWRFSECFERFWQRFPNVVNGNTLTLLLPLCVVGRSEGFMYKVVLT